MNKVELAKLLSRFELHDSLSRTEYDELHRYLERRPDVVREILDRRAVEGLLQLLATDADDDERFVSACFDKLSASRTPATPDSLATLPVHGPDASPVRVVKIHGPVKPANMSVNNWRNVTLWSSVAALILVALSAWGGFLWLRHDPADKELAVAPSLQNPDSHKIDVIRPVEIAAAPAVSPKTETEQLAAKGEPVVVDEHDFVNDNEEDPIARVDAEPTPGEKSDAVVSRDETTMQMELLNPPNEVARQPFATISTGKEGIWAGPQPAERVGAGKLKLVGGNASVDLGAGAVIRILAPAEFELLNNDYVRLQNGTYLIDMPRSATSVVIETPVGVLQNSENARVQLIVDDSEGVEALVTRGRIDLVPKDTDGYRDRLELSKNHLYQSIIRPLNDRPGISPVLMARGEKEFKGQIGCGKDVIKTDSPIIFANVLNRVAEPSNGNNPGTDVSDNWPQFARDFQALAGNMDNPAFSALLNQFLGRKEFSESIKNIGDATGFGATDFQGSLSLNGIERKFNSREEYEQARQQLMPGSRPTGLPTDPRQSNATPDVQRPINVNGRPLEFSSPDKFKFLRKQMTR